MPLKQISEPTVVVVDFDGPIRYKGSKNPKAAELYTDYLKATLQMLQAHGVQVVIGSQRLVLDDDMKNELYQFLDKLFGKNRTFLTKTQADQIYGFIKKEELAEHKSSRLNKTKLPLLNAIYDWWNHHFSNNNANSIKKENIILIDDIDDIPQTIDNAGCTYRKDAEKNDYSFVLALRHPHHPDADCKHLAAVWNKFFPIAKDRARIMKRYLPKKKAMREQFNNLITNYSAENTMATASIKGLQEKIETYQAQLSSKIEFSIRIDANDVGCDLILMSVAEADSIPTLEQLKEISADRGDAPVLIKRGNSFFIWGCLNREWKLTHVAAAEDCVIFNQLRFSNQPTLVRKATIPNPLSIFNKLEQGHTNGIGCDLILMSVAEADSIPTLEKLKEISADRGDAPVLIKQGNSLYIWGCLNGEWKLTHIEAAKDYAIFKQLQFSPEPTLVKKAIIPDPLSIFNELAQGHTYEQPVNDVKNLCDSWQSGHGNKTATALQLISTKSGRLFFVDEVGRRSEIVNNDVLKVAVADYAAQQKAEPIDAPAKNRAKSKALATLLGKQPITSDFVLMSVDAGPIPTQQLAEIAKQQNLAVPLVIKQDWCDLVLVSVTEDYGLTAEKCEKISTANQKAPLVIKKGDNYLVWGCVDGTWQLTPLGLNESQQIASAQLQFNEEVGIQKIASRYLRKESITNAPTIFKALKQAHNQSCIFIWGSLNNTWQLTQVTAHESVAFNQLPCNENAQVISKDSILVDSAMFTAIKKGHDQSIQHPVLAVAQDLDKLKDSCADRLKHSTDISYRDHENLLLSARSIMNSENMASLQARDAMDKAIPEVDKHHRKLDRAYQVFINSITSALTVLAQDVKLQLLEQTYKNVDKNKLRHGIFSSDVEKHNKYVGIDTYKQALLSIQQDAMKHAQEPNKFQWEDLDALDFRFQQAKDQALHDKDISHHCELAGKAVDLLSIVIRFGMRYDTHTKSMVKQSIQARDEVLAADVGMDPNAEHRELIYSF